MRGRLVVSRPCNVVLDTRWDRGAVGTAVPPVTFATVVFAACVASLVKGIAGKSPVAMALKAGAPAVANKA